MTPDQRHPGTLLRPVTSFDVPRLVELDAVLFADDAWSAETWWAELAGRPKREYVVAQGSDGEIVGYGGLDHQGGTADIMTIAVAPSAQGTGFGRVLLDDLVAKARARGAEALMLEVRADNLPAIALYASRNFDHLHTRRRYYQPGDVDALIMRRLLKTSEEGPR